MKKLIFACSILLAVASCTSSDSAKQNSKTESTTSASSETMPDTSVTPNQSGSTGNGGVGTGAVNQTGEQSSGSATPPQQK